MGLAAGASSSLSVSLVGEQQQQQHAARGLLQLGASRTTPSECNNEETQAFVEPIEVRGGTGGEPLRPLDEGRRLLACRLGLGLGRERARARTHCAAPSMPVCHIWVCKGEMRVCAAAQRQDNMSACLSEPASNRQIGPLEGGQQ